MGVHLGKTEAITTNETTTMATFQSDMLSSNRSNALPNGTLQLVCYYDGNDIALLSFETWGPNGLTTTQVKVPAFQTGVIVTKQYSIKGEVPTGNFTVANVVNNGVVDGVAFGMFWRDDNGGYHILRSNGVARAGAADCVCAWPLGGLDATAFALKATATTDPFARETALAVLSGAKLLPNGWHSIQVF